MVLLPSVASTTISASAAAESVISPLPSTPVDATGPTSANDEPYAAQARLREVRVETIICGPR